MKQYTKERVLSPIYLDLRKRHPESFRTSNEPFACWIDGHSIPVTLLVLNVSQPSAILESWVSGFDSICKAPISWELKGVLTNTGTACLDYIRECYMNRKECDVEFMNTTANHMQKFRSKGIVIEVIASSIDYSFNITGTAEFIESFE